jgi:immune inhibitor A
MMARQRLLEAGQTAEAAALAQTGEDRILIVLAEFDGTDVFTWTQGVSTWDPYGIADPNEDTGTAGDCSLIITETKTFTYTGPLHNAIARPLSADDRSGDAIWAEDFSPQWFDDFMFGNGVVISYTRQDNSVVFEDFTGQSVKQYYTDISSGVYTITGDIVGWVPVPHSTWYYGADQCPGARSGEADNSGAIPGAGSSRQFVRDSLDAVNAISNTIPGFDWANYDHDGDGLVDRLWLVHAGYGEEDGTSLLNSDPTDPNDPTRTTPWPEAFYGEAAIWSHSSSVTPPYSVTQDIAASAYIVMPENGGIGVFAH